MKSAQCQVSFCSRCRFYAPEGRRGGQCSQLGVPVESRWAPCSLAVPVFATQLLEMNPLSCLPQPIRRELSDIFLDAARLEAALDAPAVPHTYDQALSPPQPATVVSR
ncbi:MAG: hypothetical protein ACOYM4_08280 [Nodosilinea sp.]|jgi:hypothetical protein